MPNATDSVAGVQKFVTYLTTSVVSKTGNSTKTMETATCGAKLDDSILAVGYSTQRVRVRGTPESKSKRLRPDSTSWRWKLSSGVGDQ